MNEKDRITSLVVRLKNGDKSAFDELYKLTCSKVYFVSLKITKNEHDTEDIIQESYVTALKKLDTLEKPESFMSWFNQIVANKSKAYLRKTSPQFFEDAGFETVEAIPDDRISVSPEDAADKEDIRSKVMEAVDELTEEKRACVLMMYFGDMSVNDISQSLGVPVSTVKNRLWTARKDLKARFEKRGIAAAYSVAPMGLVSWALRSSAEAFSQTFQSSIEPSDIISVAAAGTAAAGTGIAAKIAALSTVQKIAAGVAVAGVVAGSTVGISSVVKGRSATDETISTTAIVEEYTDNYAEIPVQAPAIEIVEETPPPAPVHVVKTDKTEEKPKHEAVYVQQIVNTASQKTQYAGTIYEGINVIDFDENYNRFYCDFYAEETGYYLIYYKDNEENKLKVSFDDTIKGWEYYGSNEEKTVNYWWTEREGYAPYPDKDSETDITTVTSHPDYMTDYPKTLLYTEKGSRFIITESEENIKNAELVVEYYGEKITDVEFLNNSLNDRILDYNLMAPYATSYNNYFRMNQFDVNIKFSSKKELFMGGTEIEYYIPEGIKAGENDAVFLFPGKGIEKKMVIHDMSEYIAEIEVEELNEFLKFKINENGFDINEPDEYNVTVTYSDGTKETFNSAEWDKKLTFDDETTVVVEFTQPRLTDRESVQFIVAAGDVEFIREPCRLTGVDPIGYTKRLVVISADIIDCYWQLTEPSYRKLFTETENFRDFKVYLDDAVYITSFNTRACIDRILGYGLDLFITMVKIADENIIVE